MTAASFQIAISSIIITAHTSMFMNIIVTDIGSVAQRVHVFLNVLIVMLDVRDMKV